MREGLRVAYRGARRRAEPHRVRRERGVQCVVSRVVHADEEGLVGVPEPHRVAGAEQPPAYVGRHGVARAVDGGRRRLREGDGKDVVVVQRERRGRVVEGERDERLQRSQSGHHAEVGRRPLVEPLARHEHPPRHAVRVRAKRDGGTEKKTRSGNRDRDPRRSQLHTRKARVRRIFCYL